MATGLWGEGAEFRLHPRLCSSLLYEIPGAKLINVSASPSLGCAKTVLSQNKSRPIARGGFCDIQLFDQDRRDPPSQRAIRPSSERGLRSSECGYSRDSSASKASFCWILRTRRAISCGLGGLTCAAKLSKLYILFLLEEQKKQAVLRVVRQATP